MMHAVIMCMGGFPMLSSGDEIGQLNGYDYHDGPVLREDSRNLHRTAFHWGDAALRGEAGTVQQRIWDGLRQLETLRATLPCFDSGAWVTTWDTHSRHVLALLRQTDGERLVCLFNFAGTASPYSLDAMEDTFTDLVTGEEAACAEGVLEPYQYRLWMQRQ